jgi:hypothetical protein
MRRPTRFHRRRRALPYGLVILALAIVGALTYVDHPSAADGAFSLDRLRLGGASGPENYVFTTANVIYPDGGVDPGTYYRFVVTDRANVVRNPSFPCTPAASFTSSDNTYTVAASDSVSIATPWKVTLNQYTNSTCAGTAAKTINKTFRVARANLFADAGLTTPRSTFAPGSTVYMTVAGLVPSVSDWSVTWLSPSSATACANTAGNDRPDANSDGVLPPKTTPPYIQYRPTGGSAGVWNNESKYETAPCPDFAQANEGTWKLRLESSSTAFVVLDVFTVDAAPPPAPAIDSAPPTWTNSTSASFGFSDSEAGTTFQCSLDSSAYEACLSPRAYTGLAVGPHTFSVKGLDGLGNASAATTYQWTVDTTAPLVTLASPADGAVVNTATATISGTGGAAAGDANVVKVSVFSGTGVGGALLLTLFPGVQSGAYSVTTSVLPDGTYTVQAEQADAAGNVATSPTHTFRIDATAPSASITDAPPSLTNSNAASFSFTASETDATFRCRLDGGTFTTCVTPRTYSGLDDGQHTFEVAAVDAGGNVGSATGHTWTIDTVAPPAPVFTSTPPASTDSGDAVFAFTDADSGAVLSCALDSGGFTSCSSPRSFSALADGTHDFRVKATDQAGNTSPTTTYSWTVDTGAPSTTISSGPADPTNLTTASFAFSTSEAGATFECRLDGAAYAACSSPKTYSGLADGSHTFAVRARDLAGNTGPAATLTWTVDATGPVVTLTAPANGTTIGSASPTFSGAAGTAPGDEGTVYVDVYVGSTATGTPVRTLSATVASGAWTTTVTPPLPDGAYTAEARQGDGVGNVGRSSAHTFTIDTSGPTVTIDGHPADPTSATTATFAFSASAAGATLECGLDAAAYSACTSPTTYSSLAEGSHTFRVRATDASGNTGQAALFQWTVDVTPPQTTISSGPPDPTNATTAGFAFAAGEAGATFECHLDAAAYSACTSPRSYAGLADGTHSFAVRATDAAGNTGPAAAWSWTIDTSLPGITLTAPEDGAVLTTATPLFVGGAGTALGDGPIVSVEVYAGAAVSGTPAYTFTAGASTTWTATPTAPIADGVYTAQAEQADDSGNLARSAAHTFTIDTTPPQATISSGPADPTSASDATLVFAADEAGSSFACRLDGGAYAVCTSPQSYAGLSDGGHSFDVRATDVAGNTGLAATFTWTIDTAVATVTITSYPADPTTATGATFAFTADREGATFECSLDGVAFSACSSPQTYTGLTDGGHTFAVRATVGGTIGSAATYSWTVDTAPPEATISSRPADPTSVTSAGFEFIANDPASTFECRLDGAPFTSCTNPHSYGGLGEGTHTFAVRATDAAGNTGPVATYSWAIDLTPPSVAIDTHPSDPTSSTNASFAFSANEAGSTFECGLDGGSYTACTSPQAYSGLAEGTHTFAVLPTDAAGNTGTAATFGWTVDATAPQTTIDSGPSNPTTATTASFTFSASTSPASFECSLDGGAFGVCTSPKSYSALGDGAHVFAVRAVDAAGNVDPTPAAFTWTVDTVAPAVTLTTPAAGATVASSIPSLGGSAGSAIDDSTTITVEVYAGTTATGTPVQTLTTLRTGGTWTASATTPLADGPYTARAAQSDTAGNVGRSDPHTFTIDTTGPTAAVDSGPASPTSSTSATLTFSANEAGSFQCRLDGAPFTACATPQSYAALAEGSHVFAVRATDAAGNTGSAATFTWTVDTTAPDTGITASPANPSASTTASFALASADPTATFECRLDAAAFAPCTTPKSYTGLADGSHTFEVRAKDAAGNVDATPASYTWTVDTVAPQAGITASPPNPTNVTTASFSFAANDAGSTFSCQLDGGAFASCTSPRSYASLADGSHTFAVKATDAAGNTGGSASYSWSVDSVAPIVTLVSPSGGTASTTPTFSGSAGTAAGDATTVTVKVYSGSDVSGSVVQTLTTTRINGAYSVSASSPLVAGTYTARAEQQDAVGNVGRSASVTFAVGSGYRSAVIADAPRGYWRLGEASGTTAADETGTSAGSYQNGVVLGQPGALATDVNTAASFDGVNDVVSVPNATPLNATSGVTVEAWVKRTKSGAWQNIVAKPGNGANASQNYALWVNTLNQPVAIFGNNSTSVAAYAPAIDTNWHHVAATYDNATAKVYVDGVLKVSVSSTVQLTANTQPLLIGRTTDNTRIFGGVLDEPAVYTTALSASQIAAHYASATSIDTTAPAVTLTAPADGTTTDNQLPTFAGASGTDPGDANLVTVKIYDGSTPTGTPVQTLTATPAAGSWSVTPTTPLADGLYTAQAEQSDTAGNIGRSSANTFSITADDLTPPAVTLVSPADGSSTTDPTPTLSGGAGTAAGDLPAITVKIWKGLYPSGTPLQTLTPDASGGSWSVDAAYLAQGVYAVRAQQMDTAGNTGFSAPHTFTIGTTYSDEVMADSPAAYWRFGEASGTVAVDQKGANPGSYQNGVLLGQPGGLTADPNTAASFDGVNDVVSVPNATGLSATSGVTVEAWVKRTKSGAWQNVLGKPGNGANASQNYALWLNTTNQPVALFGNGSTSVAAYAPAIDTNWHHVAATYDNATAKVYVDGVLKVSVSSTVHLTANTQPLLIGRTTDNLRIFGGVIDEPAVYTTALSATRIQQHYIKASPIDTDAPIVTLSTPVAGSSTLNTIPHFAGQAATTGSDAATVTVKIFAGASATGTPVQTLTGPWVTSGAWSLDATAALPLGTYTAQAEQRDVAGNVGTSDAHTFTIVAPAATTDPVLAGAGDIADCTDSGVQATAALILGLPSSTTVMTLGDNAYPHGSASDFANCYDPTWGQFKSRTHPAIGDHEYETPNASGYFNYFQQQLAPYGASATDPNRAYYSYDLGTWHVVVLNGACSDAPACNATTQAAWLDSDLSTHTNQCTVGVLAAPRWSSGSVHGSNASMATYFDVLYDHGAELVLGGDDHLYERFAPMDPQGFYDPTRGVRQIVAGTGGGSLYSFGTIRANSEVRRSGSYGILKLALHAGSYEWEFIPTSGSFSDSGTTPCH